MTATLKAVPFKTEFGNCAWGCLANLYANPGFLDYGNKSGAMIYQLNEALLHMGKNHRLEIDHKSKNIPPSVLNHYHEISYTGGDFHPATLMVVPSLTSESHMHMILVILGYKECWLVDSSGSYFPEVQNTDIFKIRKKYGRIQEVSFFWDAKEKAEDSSAVLFHRKRALGHLI